MRSIAIIGGKGGVGKTTVASNLSVSLAKLGYDVTAIDTNLTTPNLGIHLGMPITENTIHDVLRGLELTKAIYFHPSNLKVITGSLSIEDLNDVKLEKLSDIVSSIKSDYIILDSAAGLGREALASLTASEETLIVTNPETTAVADALRTIRIAERLGKNIIGVVVNRRKGKKYELNKLEIESMLSYPVIAEIPEDPWVKKSLMRRTSIVELKPWAPSAIEFMNLALTIAGHKFRLKRSFIDRLFSWR